MKKVSTFLLAVICAGVVFGQDKKVAMLEPIVKTGNVTDFYKEIILAALDDAITATSGYRAFTRLNVNQISKEQAFQWGSGMVNDAERKRVGVMTGCEYICISELSGAENIFIKSSLIHIETGEIIATANELLTRSESKIYDGCQKLADKLVNKSTGRSHTTTTTTTTTTTPRPSGKNITFTANGVSFEMIFVEGGTFVMGCTSEQSDCKSNEKPTHSVTLTDYYMGKYEVTQKLWQAVMGTNVRQQRDLRGDGSLYGEGDDYPMYYINYNECEEFCAKLNKLLSSMLPDGYKFRLPTEAQWEYSARGGKKSKGYKYSGGDYIGEVAWYDGNSGSKTHEVGMKDKNELGIFDMSGNVWEWCQDWYGESYYSSSPSSNPKGASSGSDRVLRGGSWGINAQNCRVAHRFFNTPGFRRDSGGFRLALVP